MTRYWTRERIIEAIRLHEELNGRPPALIDFGGGDYRFPSHRTVTNFFGSWNAAIVAAGFAPRRKGWPCSTPQ